MGRPRKAGPREPSGRPSRSDRVQHVQRELDALRLMARDHKLGSPLGVLLRAGKITAKQFDAGMWFAEARASADAALGLPARSCRAQDLSAVRGAGSGQEDAAAKNRAIAAYDRAVAYLGHGSKRLAAVELVVVYERRPDTYEQVLALVDGLDAIIALRTIRRAA